HPEVGCQQEVRVERGVQCEAARQRHRRALEPEHRVLDDGGRVRGEQPGIAWLEALLRLGKGLEGETEDEEERTKQPGHGEATGKRASSIQITRSLRGRER